MHKYIALIDCNSFFCSCEILFKPHLKNKPVIVLSNNDGCAVSRTPEAKKLGIKMGDPYFKIKDLCKKHNVGVFSSNFSLYTDMSARVMKVLKGFSHRMEVYSIDEAWLDLSHIKSSDLHSYGKEIKETVERLTGIPVGVGIAQTKTLAKVANHIAKKDKSKNGVHVLVNESEIHRDLKRFPIEDIWGIGRQSAIKLKMMRIRSAYDFMSFKNDKYIGRLLTKVGLQRSLELMGIPCFEIEPEPPKKKQILVSRTFGKDVYDKNKLKEAISNHVESACKKLRSQGSRAKSISVFFRTSPFSDGPKEKVCVEVKFNNASSDTFFFLKHALRIVDNEFKLGVGYKRSGVWLDGISSDDETQLDLFSCSPINEKRDILNKTIDIINEIHGPGTIKALSSATSNNVLKMLRNFKTPRFTTSWDELQKVG